VTVSAGTRDGDAPTVGQSTCVTANESISPPLLPVAATGTEAGSNDGGCEAL